jgi:two-component system, cell cycle sensor histidine kinase and response regulator CckA
MAAMGIPNSIDQYSEQLLLKLQATVEQSPVLVMIADSSGVLEYVNPAFELLTGFSRDEVIGHALKSEQQSGESFQEMWDTVLSGRVFHGTEVNRKKNGETFVLEKIITPLRNPVGQITHFICTGRDITEQRRLESELQQAKKMDVVGRLAGGVAHDFNNLLMVISANAELTLDSLEPNHPSRQYIGEILDASRRAGELTRQLLAFGRKQVQSLQMLDLNAVVQQVSRMLSRLIGEDIKLIFVPARNLSRVEADPIQIEQVLMNLAANARDGMPEGGTLTIETGNLLLDGATSPQHATVPPGNYVLITVTDSGQGISPEHLPHIFEPFYTTKEEGKGTGLGLATVYSIVKQSGGQIRVYTEVGVGTSFRIYLPQAQATAMPSVILPLVQDAAPGRETVLLVEDEKAVRQSAQQFLTKSGYTVLEASTPQEALHISHEYDGAIHMMISDVVLPQMSGPALAGHLSTERPEMKTLFVSGYAENTVLRHGEIDLSKRFLQKPFGLRTLANKTREILDTPAVRTQAAASR